jgi:hypothetical protein
MSPEDGNSNSKRWYYKSMRRNNPEDKRVTHRLDNFDLEYSKERKTVTKNVVFYHNVRSC